MPTQGELFDQAAPPRTAAPRDGASRDGDGSDPAQAPVWLQRMSLIILVLFCFYIGTLLTVLPWSPRFWDGNGWLRAHPALHDVLMRGWARGLLSGFGLLDIWIGISELLHYREHRRLSANVKGGG